MKSPLLFLAVFAVGSLFSACSTTDSRISEHQASFQSLSPEDQARIRKGDVEVGFTEDMVMMAMGKPDRRYSRTTDKGTVDIWAYQSKAPAISIGFGIGGGSGHTGVGAGVGMSTGDRSDDRVRIVFQDHRVTTIERAAKR